MVPVCSLFQRIFGKQENKDILLSLLNAILGFWEEKKIQDIEIIENTKLEKDRIEDKQGILDVRAKTAEGSQINIEIQLLNQYNMDKRTLFYWSKMYTEQLQQGQSFTELKKTITINILDFDFLELQKYHNIFHLWKDQQKDYMLTDIIEIHFIELSKFRKSKPDIQNPLQRWLLFLENAPEEVLEMIKQKDPAIEKAETVLDWLSSDKEAVRLYELREKAIHDEATRIMGTKCEIAKNLLGIGLDIDTIAKTTGLDKSIIEEMKH